MKEIDWSQTSLGPVESWPQSLKTAVRIILTSRQPMFVWWGEELINLYNDAYIAIVGGKHPEALGQPAALVWKEIWTEIGPRVTTALNSNTGTYDEALMLIMERSGYPEETFYTFSYSPVPDGQGGNGGIFCANTDDTARIIGARQLALLQSVSSTLSDARTIEEASQKAMSCLTGRDVTFAALYLQDQQGGFQRIGAAGFDGNHEAVPLTFTPEAATFWPLDSVLDTAHPVVVEDLSGTAPFPSGPWDRPPSKVALIAVAPPGEYGRSGILMVGLNPYRLFDESYQNFVRLLSTQLAAGFANAQAYEEERKRAEALAELDRAKTNFFSNISHEFRTPLTLMLGPTEEALSNGSLSGPELASVHRNQLRLLKMVNALLDFSRIEAGRMEATYLPTALDTFTTGLASMFESAVNRLELEYRIQIDSLGEPIYVDPTMWEKIVLNLISNALKFTFEGYIEVRLTLQDDKVVFSVEDSGSGIPADQLPHLFKRFHRVEGARSRTHEGSGIGLALVQDLVALHGGTVSVQSELEEGTTFTVSIPRGTSHLPFDRVQESEQLDLPSSRDIRAYVDEALLFTDDDRESEDPASTEQDLPVVLLAEDNADMRDYIGKVLAGRLQVRTASDGLKAWNAIQERQPDLLLTDVMMPGMNGFELLQAVRSQDSYQALPVIMLSARAGEEARAEGLEAGADDYLVKPFSARELLARVEGNLALGRVRRTLFRERSAYALVFQQAPIPIAVLRGQNLIFELANPAYEAVVGRSAFVGKTLMEALPELEGQGFEELLLQVMHSGREHVANEAPVRLARGPKGEFEQAYFTYIYAPLIDGDPLQEPRVVCIANDVTAQVNARSVTERLASEAQAANRAKDEFLAMLGHELRNPLSPILTAIELLRMRGRSTRELDILQRQVGNLVRLVDDLLDVSRIAQGKVSLDKQVTEIFPLILSALETASPLFEERGQVVVSEVPRQGLAVYVDPGRIVQVVSNLLTNAAKYSGAGTTVKVVASAVDSSVQLVVEDQGAGIEQEMLDRVFELFTQRSQTIDRSLGGLGLGLSIVKSMVSLHGGSVRAESEGLGKGSRFVVELPAAPTALSTASGSEKSSTESSAGIPGLMNILIVDDNRDAARTLALVLEARGHTVRTAHDGPSALKIVADFPADVAFLDIGLPVMNGYELAGKMREMSPSTHLVAVTGYGQEEDRRRSKEAGFSHHLVKPVAMDEIRQFLTGWSSS